MTEADTHWLEANQRYLVAAVAEVRAMLEEFLGKGQGEPGRAGRVASATAARETALAEMAPPPALEVLATVFGLSSFERKILVMCAGAELDSNFARLFSDDKKQGHGQPVFSLALAAFTDAHWSALSPSRPLRRWRFIDLLPGDAITTSPLRIDERVLHHLAGIRCVDERLTALLSAPGVPTVVAPSYEAAGREIATAWARSKTQLPIVQLCGEETAAKRAIAAAAAAAAGLGLHILDTRNVRLSLAELNLSVCLIEREVVLGTSVLLIECDDTDAPWGLPESAVVQLIEGVRGPVIVATRTPRRPQYRASLIVDVGKPGSAEQTELWKRALNGLSPALNGDLPALVSQFSFGPAAIQSAAEQILGEPGEADVGRRLWEICRVHARPHLQGLAQRIETGAKWDDLVLPERQSKTLREIAVHVRRRAKVYQEWGFASKGLRGLGISALFAGASGTGKTMAGEVLANELKLDLYRIDLSQVVSKYIGETEKNLRRVFDAAEDGAAILLFDEADALFGKRSDVKDSHDRYANIEVSYLLQRMESYRGLAVLTTNRKSALDPAFMRRLRFVVEFPFPDSEQRAEIWRRVFPPQTPVQDLRIDRLARLNASGGHIRNIALWAAFLAADAGQPVGMPHLLSAARSEFAKVEKPLADMEVAGWV